MRQRGQASVETIALIAAVLALAAWGLTRAVRFLPRRRFPVWARHGLAALGRPGTVTFGSIVANGFQCDGAEPDGLAGMLGHTPGAVRNFRNPHTAGRSEENYLP